jgi:Putative lactococcus lactis phage r1t holin
MTRLEFWEAALIRAVKTFAQTMLAVIGTDLVGITDVDWLAAAEVAAVAGILSLLTSVVSSPFGEKGTPGLPGEDIPATRKKAKAADSITYEE